MIEFISALTWWELIFLGAAYVVVLPILNVVATRAIDWVMKRVNL